jgi:probable O-glycosylation ligase (exosortase A-associated)
MRDLILTAIILVCACVALRRPVFGMLTFVWLGFFNPQGMTWGSTPHSLIIAFSTIAGYFSSSEPKRFPLQREAILLLLLWIVFGLSTVFAIYPNWAVGQLGLVSKILLMVFFTMLLITTNERLLWLVRVIALSIGFYAVKGVLFIVATGGEYNVFGPSGSFLQANNMIGLAFAVNLPLLAYLIKHEEKAWLRWVCRAMFVCSYPSTIFTYSRGAWLGMATVTVLMALRSRYKFRIATAGAVFALFLLPFAVALIPERLTERYEDLENYDTESSAQMRFGSWAYCWRVAADRPLIGGGFNHYSVETYDKYAPEFLDQWGGKNRWRRTSCHSIWFTVISEHGFLGSILWFGLFGSFLLSTLHIRSLTTRHPEMLWMYDLAGALQFSLIGFAVVGTFIDSTYFDMLYYLIAILVIMKENLNGSLVAAAPAVNRAVDARALLPTKNSLIR